jgi:hypothetical protein
MWYLLDETTGATSVSGIFADRKLPEVYAVRRTWKDWKAAHPNSKYMRY